MKLQPLVDSLLVDVGRSQKPRDSGLTIVLDVGLGCHGIDDLVAASGPHIDFAKIAWGSSLVTTNLEEKIERYRNSGIEPMLGGTLFEYAYLHSRVNELFDFVRAAKVHVEISDGTIQLPAQEKLRWIEKFASVVSVFSEVGGKREVYDLDWPAVIAAETSAGAKKIVVEGRQVGPVGQPIRDEFVDELLTIADAETLVFEALERKQQLYFLSKVGVNVNLANVRPGDALTLESFRHGLKEHTLKGLGSIL